MKRRGEPHLEERTVDLTNEDVADILALLDSLPYDSLDSRRPGSG